MRRKKMCIRDREKIVEANIGTVFEKSDNAIIFPGENYGLHTRVFISSKGTDVYKRQD